MLQVKNLKSKSKHEKKKKEVKGKKDPLVECQGKAAVPHVAKAFSESQMRAIVRAPL